MRTDQCDNGRLEPVNGVLQPAILLLGPTGSGKTPLGEYLEANGLCGKRCVHFDFGAGLRAFASGNDIPPGLSQADVEHVKSLLATGGLLEDDKFHIAQAVLSQFLLLRGLKPADVVVLNGLPRHVGQANGVCAVVDVRLVVVLECSADVVLRRISTDAGGDREGRKDDERRLVAEKIRIFTERTMPLLDHYRARHVRIHAVHVGTRMKAAEAAAMVPPVV